MVERATAVANVSTLQKAANIIISIHLIKVVISWINSSIFFFLCQAEKSLISDRDMALLMNGKYTISTRKSPAFNAA